jgi:hypothetical protein
MFSKKNPEKTLPLWKSFDGPQTADSIRLSCQPFNCLRLYLFSKTFGFVRLSFQILLKTFLFDF